MRRHTTETMADLQAHGEGRMPRGVSLWVGCFSPRHGTHGHTAKYKRRALFPLRAVLYTIHFTLKPLLIRLPGPRLKALLSFPLHSSSSLLSNPVMDIFLSLAVSPFLYFSLSLSLIHRHSLPPSTIYKRPLSSSKLSLPLERGGNKITLPTS